MAKANLVRLLGLLGIAALLLVMQQGLPAYADGTSTISGRAVYFDAEDNPIGIQGAKVTVCEEDFVVFVPFANCVDSETDSDGNFSVLVEDDDAADDQLNVYVDIRAIRPEVKAIPGLDPTGLVTYCFRHGKSRNVISEGDPFDFGDISPLGGGASCDIFQSDLTDERENAAFWVFTELVRGWQFLSGVTQSVNGEPVPAVTARMMPDFDLGSVSFYALDTIFVMPDTWSDIGNNHNYGTIFHEYGHHLLYNFAESPFPDYANETCDGTLIEIGPIQIPENGHCRWQSELGNAAWTEGFPTFLAHVLDTEIYGNGRLSGVEGVWEIDGASYYTKGVETPAMLNGPVDGTELFTLNNGSGVFEEHPDTDYEHVEGFTSAVLWDLYDPATDDHNRDRKRDTASLSFHDIWTVVSNFDPDPSDDDHNHPLNLAEFYDGARALLSGEISPARLAGPFLENHFTVPAINLEVNDGSFTTHQDWSLLEVFGRGDTIPALYEVCRPVGGMAWEGEVEVGIRLFQTSSGFSEHTPPLVLPDQVEGGCADGIYEFTVRADFRLPGPKFIGGSIIDNRVTLQSEVCVDHRNQLAETDESDNCSNTEPLLLQNKPPIIETNGLGTEIVLDEGSDLDIDLTGSYDPDPIVGDNLQYRVIIPGHYDSGFVSNPVFQIDRDSNDFLADGIDPAADLVVQILVRDLPENFGTANAADSLLTLPLTINNVEPVTLFTNLPANGRFQIFEGTELTIVGLFVDPGMDDWTVYGFFSDDGSSVDGTISNIDYVTFIIPNHYQGEWAVTRTFEQDTVGRDDDFFVCVDDGDGEGCTVIGGARVTVHNVAPSIDLPTSFVGAEGDTIDVEGSFTDPGADAWTGTAAIDGGVPFAIDIDPSRTFSIPVSVPQDGFFDVEVCIDDGLAEDCESTTLEVANVAPDFDFTPIAPINEGSDIHVAESFVDPGADTWTATVAYDGGAPVALPLVGKSFSIDRTYVEDGAYSVEVCISDDDVAECRTLNVAVLNVAPDVTLDITPALVLVLVEDTFSATFDDPGTEDTHTATIDWGDGHVDAIAVQAHATETGAVQGAHAYDSTGDFTVEVCVEDDELDSGCASYVIEVVTPEEALREAIEDLEANAALDEAVADALAELEGAPTSSNAGALDKLESGDLVAALAKLLKAVEALDEAGEDYSSIQLLLAQIAESVAREQLRLVEALGLTSNGDIKKLNKIRDHVSDGRDALESGEYADAIEEFKGAVQKAKTLL